MTPQHEQPKHEAPGTGCSTGGILIHSARPLPGTALASGTPAASDAGAWLLVRGGRIAAAGSGERWRAHRAERVVDAGGAYLAPGFVDIHCHGAGGAAFDEEDGAPVALAAHAARGTGTLVASLVANPVPRLAESLRRLAALRSAHPMLAGAHLEGPCLSPAHRGAHHPDHLAVPTVAMAEELLAAADGSLRQVTLAPELDPGLQATRYLISQGVRVAVGHTDADYATARAAFDAGASLLTHTFNAMRGLHHRAPGPVAAALDSGHVTLEVIADGVHVHAPMVRMLFAAAPGRVALVTDAMAAACCGDGAYRLGDLDVEVSGGIARLAGGGAIAGSTLTMDAAVAYAVGSGVPLAQAVEAATIVPARALGLEGPAAPAEGNGLAAPAGLAGTLEPGAPAPVLLDGDGRLVSVA